MKERAPEGAANKITTYEQGPKLKQYLVVKVNEGLTELAHWIAMPGLYTLGAAQDFVDRAMAAEPDATFLIQEVGKA